MDREYNSMNNFDTMIFHKMIMFGTIFFVITYLVIYLPQQFTRPPPYYTVYDTKEKIAYMLPPEQFMKWKAAGEPPIGEFVKQFQKQQNRRPRRDPHDHLSNFPPVSYTLFF